MSALDKLQNFSAKSTVADDGVFDVKTPAGAFLQRVHKAGYKMYEPCYKLKDEFHVDESTLSGEDLEAYHKALVVSAEAYELFNEQFCAMYEPSFQHTELHDVLTTDGNQIVNAVAGSGKALMNGTGVLTATGYRPIETLNVDDLVFGEDGKLHQVQGVFPQGQKEVYLMEFSDGNKIFCSGDHLWEIVDKDASLVLTTAEILQTVKLRDKNGNYCCKVPVAHPLELEDSKFGNLPPYLVGFLLIALDNHYNRMVFHTRCVSYVQSIEEYVRNLFGGEVVYEGCYNEVEIFCDELRDQLKDLGIVGVAQHDRTVIPQYLYTNTENRLEFLRGIVDACDSGYDKYITVASRDVAESVSFLFESLGAVVSMQEMSGNYCISVESGDRPLYVVLRDKEEKVCSTLRTNAIRYITHIEALGYEREMTCIAVDSPRHLFLTEHCIPTHNTTMLVFKILYDIVTGRCMTLKELDNGMTVRTANKVWVCTFLRSGARELESALTNWQYKFGYSQTAPTLTFSTMDAEFKRCLNAMGVATPLDEGGKLYSCMTKAIDACNIKRNGYNLTKEDYNIIGGIITYYRGRLDDQKYAHPSCADYELTPTILDLVVKQFAQLRQQAGIMDFSEIMELLYKYLYVTPNPQVQEFVANRYNFIYIDEFQDTSQMAYAILKFYARGKLWLNRSGEEPTEVPNGLYTGHETLGKLVVVGDTAQCVMPGTEISLAGGVVKDVADVDVGDEIEAMIGRDRLGYVRVDQVMKRMYSGNEVKLTLSNNKVLCLTEDHKCFVKAKIAEAPADIELCMFGGEHMQTKLILRYPDGEETYEDYNVENLEELIHSALLKFDTLGIIPVVRRSAILFVGEKYNIVGAGDVSFGDVMCAVNPVSGEIEQAAVLGVDHTFYEGPVYDFNIYDVHNFVANGVVVHNCIYSFRGSDSTILAKTVAEDFNPIISTLSVNWRCPNVILDPIVPSIHKNWDSADQNIQAANKGGEIFAYAFKNYSQMIAQLKTDIAKDMEDGLKVAVLCRTNFDGLIPAVVLEQDGRFNFSVSGENMTMNSPLPRKLIGMTSLFTERATPAVKNSLMEFAGRTNGWAVKNLMDTLKLQGWSIWDIPEDDLRHSCPVLVDFVKDIRPLLFENGKRVKDREIEALQVVYFKLMNEVYDGDSAYCESARAYLETLLFIIEHGNFKTVYEFLEEIEYLNDRLNGRIKKSKVYVQIATVHEFKGKEADSVYVWNDNDGVFPYSKTDLGVEDEVNEERRVHYIACTRAKKREHIYSIAGRIGMFAREMDVKFTNPVPVAAKLPKKP